MKYYFGVIILLACLAISIAALVIACQNKNSETLNDIRLEELNNKRLKLSTEHEEKIYSQNGEDGIIKSIFSMIKTKDKYYVEFGTEDGTQINTRLLREKKGWKGLMLDGGYENKKINLRKHFLDKDNIVEIFKKYKVPKKFDLLSTDIDLNDFYVLHSILKKYKPRVVICEYNASFPPPEDKVVIYEAEKMWDRTRYFGMSLQAANNLLTSYGYVLVYTERKGVNAFFVQSKYAKFFEDAGNVEKLYHRPGYGRSDNGHIPDDKNRKWITSTEAMLII